MRRAVCAQQVFAREAPVNVYSQRGARIRNISRNPKVTLNFGGDGNGGDIVILSATAEVVESGPSADKNAAWGALPIGSAAG